PADVEHLEHDEVGAGRGEHRRLLAIDVEHERLARRRRARRLLVRPPDRHRAGDRDRPARRRPLARVARGPDRGAIHLLDAVGLPGGRHREPVGRERVGDDHVRAHADVVLVDLTDEVGRVEVRERAPGLVVHRRAARLELGAHPAVDDEDGVVVRRWAHRRASCRIAGKERGMKPFVVNRHGRLVFPSNFLPELDFSVVGDLERLDAVIGRDFEAKAPTGTDILEAVESGGYESRYELMRAVALNLVWVNRYAMTMYEKRPARWRDVPRRRDDVFLPVLTPWEDGARKVAAVGAAYDALPAGEDPAAEERIFRMLFDVFSHRPHHATELPAIKPTVAEILATPDALTFCLDRYDPDYPVFGFEAIRDCREDVPALESLHRIAMVLHDQYPWERARTGLKAVGTLGDDDFVVVFAPRSGDVMDFIRRVKAGETPRARPVAPDEARAPVAPYPALRVRERFGVRPRIEALA